MNTHGPGVQSFFRFLASFCIGQFSQQHKGYVKLPKFLRLSFECMLYLWVISTSIKDPLKFVLFSMDILCINRIKRYVVYTTQDILRFWKLYSFYEFHFFFCIHCILNTTWCNWKNIKAEKSYEIQPVQVGFESAITGHHLRGLVEKTG